MLPSACTAIYSLSKSLKSSETISHVPDTGIFLLLPKYASEILSLKKPIPSFQKTCMWPFVIGTSIPFLIWKDTISPSCNRFICLSGCTKEITPLLNSATFKSEFNLSNLTNPFSVRISVSPVKHSSMIIFWKCWKSSGWLITLPMVAKVILEISFLPNDAE